MTILKTPRTDERELKNGGCYGYDFARELETELTAAQQTIRDLQAERESLRDTLKQYADPSNWRMNSWTDSNSSNFDGMGPAIKALSTTNPSEAKQQEAMVPYSFVQQLVEVLDVVDDDYNESKAEKVKKQLQSYAPKQPTKE